MKLVYLDILCESIENLFCNLDSFGKISLSLLINNILPRIIPIEITDGFLKKEQLWEAQRDFVAKLALTGYSSI